MPADDVAIFSDIHGNLQALQAVLADIEALGIQQKMCLGDIVGYGANPGECVALVRSTGAGVVMGNHEAMMFGNGVVPDLLEPSIQLARRQMPDEQRVWLERLPLTLEVEDYEVAHATLWKPANWEYVRTTSHADLHFNVQKKTVSFIGHTHRPCIWVEKAERSIDPIGSEDLRPGQRYIVNVGSVGQPRDEEPKACYVVYSRQSGVVRYRRLAYDVAGAQAAIIGAGLPPYFADRLGRGK